jgi:hypothetical protein
MRRLSVPEVAREIGGRAADRIRTLVTPDSPWPAVEQAYRGLVRG